MADFREHPSVLSEKETNSIISSHPHVLRVSDISLGRTRGGIQLLFHGQQEFDVDKLPLKPEFIPGLAVVEYAQLWGHIESLKDELPTVEEKILDCLNKMSEEFSRLVNLVESRSTE